MYLHCIGAGRMRITQERPTLKRGTPVIIKTGLIISDEKQHLACSHDDIMEDKSVDDRHGTAEYKCPI